MIKEFETVLLLKDLPDDGLLAGDIGVVVDVLASGKAFIVEFMTLSGKTLAVRTLHADEIRSLRGEAMPRVRELALAA